LASFENHLKQAKSNINFLLHINQTSQNFWDWQVTTCFYIAVHTVNAHIAKVANLHYQTHEAVKHAINPHSVLSLCKIDENIYLDYAKLEGLSRRSRYLCNESTKQDPDMAHITFDRHLAKAIKLLDRLLVYFNSKYALELDKIVLNCVDLKNTPLILFSIK
jgi:hypothetical protein